MTICVMRVACERNSEREGGGAKSMYGNTCARIYMNRFDFFHFHSKAFISEKKVREIFIV